MVITMILMRKVEGVVEGTDKRVSIERRGPKRNVIKFSSKTRAEIKM